MGIVGGKQLDSEQVIGPCRIVIRLDLATTMLATGPGKYKLSQMGFAGLNLRPYITASALQSVASKAESIKPNKPNGPMGSYFLVDIPDGRTADQVLEQLRDMTNVETAYQEPRPIPPPVNYSDDPFSALQGYLNPAPQGIDAFYIWTQSNGKSVSIIDVEQGWGLDHEDLVDARITLLSGINRSYHGHGTAVLGQLAASDNQVGCIGICPEATLAVVSEFRDDGSYNTADALITAAAGLSFGDVVLIEAQAHYGEYRNLPVEVYDATFDVIRAITDAGIIVVEAAGNGAQDLDDFSNWHGQKVLNRSDPAFKDSGAILVAAATSTVPHAKSSFSNFGSRIDCFGWGDNIVTCGSGAGATGVNTYIFDFGGTSGASPMVAGAAVLLQSWSRNIRGSSISPQGMRTLLSSSALNTRSRNPSEKIGVLPDLRSILEHLTSSPVKKPTWRIRT